ncbi:hypothetical protein FH608_019130 [Nonomuraea phyllanthi]|uniref:Uncharacterized protein n=1 Tax=Nonomuraea phyllanthi TaxID=2219224 RepID=A0A5C4WKA9_9ACTN|nr:MFS transporter [Nonomuraea phyllanthi]KAB8194272.1 hypothetical protein FH608_019130 [Nonomuraea phyllanthi]
MLLTGACLNPMWYFPTLSMQRVLGYGPLQTGLAFLPPDSGGKAPSNSQGPIRRLSSAPPF